MAKRDTVINIRPFDIQFNRSQHGFIIVFLAPIKDDYTHRKVVKVHLERWWIKIIANGVWKIINNEQLAIDELKDKMKEGENG